jgi:hypothetical protein
MDETCSTKGENTWCRIVVGKPRRLGCRCEDNVKMDLKEMYY